MADDHAICLTGGLASARDFTVLIAPVGCEDDPFDPGSRWELLSPTCPDAPPEDLGGD